MNHIVERVVQAVSEYTGVPWDDLLGSHKGAEGLTRARAMVWAACAKHQGLAACSPSELCGLIGKGRTYQYKAERIVDRSAHTKWWADGMAHVASSLQQGVGQ